MKERLYTEAEVMGIIGEDEDVAIAIRTGSEAVLETVMFRNQLRQEQRAKLKEEWK